MVLWTVLPCKYTTVTLEYLYNVNFRHFLIKRKLKLFQNRTWKSFVELYNEYREETTNMIHCNYSNYFFSLAQFVSLKSSYLHSPSGFKFENDFPSSKSRGLRTDQNKFYQTILFQVYWNFQFESLQFFRSFRCGLRLVQIPENYFQMVIAGKNVRKWLGRSTKMSEHFPELKCLVIREIKLHWLSEKFLTFLYPRNNKV